MFSNVRLSLLRLPFALILAWAATSVSWAQAQRSLDFIVAVVNSEPITRNQVLLKQAKLKAQSIGAALPAGSDLNQLALERLVQERLMLQIAKERGIKISDEQLNFALLNVARQNRLSKLSDLQRKFESEGGNWASYTAEIRDDLLLAQVREREVESKIKISEAEIDAELQTKLSMRPTNIALQELNLAQILVALPDNPTAEQVALARAKALQIAAKARAGDDFSKLALEFSDAADKATGGVMGLRSAQRYPDLFLQMVQNLQVGEISSAQQSGAGFHVLKLLAKKDSSQLTVTQTRSRHILLPLSDNLSELQAKNRLLAFKSQIEKNQAPFEALAQQHSTDSSAADGGDLGWVRPGQFVREFEAAMNQLAIGQVSPPVVSQFGVHLIQVTDRREIPIPDREQRELIRAELIDRKSDAAYLAWITENRNRAFIEYRNETTP